MKEVCDAIDRLIAYARAKLGLSARNETYVRNTVLDLVGLESYEGAGQAYDGRSVSVLLRELVDACARAGLPAAERAERLTDSVMGALMLPPESVEEAFAAHMAVSSEEATEWLYSYSVLSDYVKKEKLDANPRFSAENGLIVTINKAKPEFRDPKKAVSGNSVKGGYPKCTICRENEGYFGRSKRTLRTVTLELDGEEWFWQFSPYGYFYQHGIAVNAKHIPMHVDRGTFVKLMQFVDLFPHYFIGCNAPLPRIGGSVLAHDHFQGHDGHLFHQGFPVAQLPDKVGGDTHFLQMLHQPVAHLVVDNSLALDGALFQTVEGGGIVLVVHNQQLRVFCCVHFFGFALVKHLFLFHETNVLLFPYFYIFT